MERSNSSQEPKLSHSRAFPTMGLTDDLFYATEWGAANGWFDRLAAEPPLMVINSAVMTNRVRVAIALLAAAGMKTSTIWSLEDIVQPRVFSLILTEAKKHLRSYEVRQLEFLLIAIARDWVQLNTDQVAHLRLIAAEMPSPRRARPLRNERRTYRLHRRDRSDAFGPKSSIREA